MNIEDISNARYTCDLTKLEELRTKCPWNDHPKYLTKAAISPSAVTKMMMHCQSGVDKGIKKGGRPIEVMGLLLGRPDPVTPHTLVITDVFPLSVEGFETSVVADDVEVANEMIRTSESIDRTRHERIMGWYHSHPFDVGVHSNCFLSSTDIQTQLNYQRAEDPNGNPWLGIVVDPLRSLVKKRPEIKAFRAYPPGYNAPENECPDGSIILEEKLRLEMWGKSWASYYELEIEYFMSAAARKMMSILTQNYFWMTMLGSTQMTEPENKEEFPVKVNAVADKIKIIESSIPANPLRGVLGMGVGGVSGSSGAASSGRGVSSEGEARNEREREKAYKEVVELAKEKLHGNISQITKRNLFC